MKELFNALQRGYDDESRKIENAKNYSEVCFLYAVIDLASNQATDIAEYAGRVQAYFGVFKKLTEGDKFRSEMAELEELELLYKFKKLWQRAVLIKKNK